MTITPLDIRKQDFSRSFRGYDIDEVEAFLQLIANQWQEMSDETRRLTDNLRASEQKLDHYRKVEEALEEALQTARTGARQTIENAERKARSIVDLAETRALSITHEAENERLDTRREAARYSARQHEIVAKMRAFLMSEMEILAGYESDQSLVDRTPREALVEAEISDHDTTEVAAEESDALGDVGDQADSVSSPEEDEIPDTEHVADDEQEEADEASSSFVFESGTGVETTEETEHPAWRVTPIISPESTELSRADLSHADQSETTESHSPVSAEDESGVSEGDEVATEEIKKIRQILEDLEK